MATATATATRNRKRAAGGDAAPDTFDARVKSAMDNMTVKVMGTSRVPGAMAGVVVEAPARPAADDWKPRIVVTPDARFAPPSPVVNPQFFPGHDSDRDRATLAPTIAPGPVEPAPFVNRSDDDDYIDSGDVAPYVFDPTATPDGDLTIRHPSNGGVWRFRVETWRHGRSAGKRMVAILAGHKWEGFAFTDEFGVELWGRTAGQSDFVAYARMLNNNLRFVTLGYAVSFDPA